MQTAPEDTFDNYPEDFFSLHAEDIDGNDVDFKSLHGKKAYLIINVASACGLTDAGYKGLKTLYDKYKDQGLEILAFPCNQFGAQEPKCELDVKNFATDKYQASFPLFSKIDVNGQNTHDVYRFLRGQSDLRVAGTNKAKPITWNFSKFLLDKDGKVAKTVAPGESPANMEEDIKNLLA